MRYFIGGLLSKMILVFVTFSVIGLGLLAVSALSYAFDIDALGAIVVMAIISLLWQTIEVIREGKDNE